MGEELINKVKTIEHVGSTSVEGLSAKPIIDIDIVIEDENNFVGIRNLLESKGYIHEGNLGIENREAFKYYDKPNLMTHHLYVCPKNSKELYKHINFRNYLRNNQKLVNEYSKIKEDAAKLYPEDIEKYMEFKSEFIENVYKE